jgi:hypothetical protein
MTTKKGRPTHKAQLEKLGFDSVAIDQTERHKTMTATFNGAAVTMRAYPGDNLIEIAKGWLGHAK